MDDAEDGAIAAEDEEDRAALSEFFDGEAVGEVCDGGGFGLSEEGGLVAFEASDGFLDGGGCAGFAGVSDEADHGFGGWGIFSR